MFNRLERIDVQTARSRVKLGDADSLLGVGTAAARHMFNFNTVESTLLGSCVFVCLSGIMFQSGQFNSPQLASNKFP